MNIIELNQREVSSVVGGAGLLGEFSAGGLLFSMACGYTLPIIINGFGSKNTSSTDIFFNRLDCAFISGSIYIFAH
ncbi:MAG: hypothetical protein KKE11_00955 [Gammaproteobacteria bacterium]|nr:hypothetical protein [Gammaproteobacteria bacterium]